MATTLIFPMAGQGARFDYQFKPFLEIEGELFIAAAVAPFRAHRDALTETLFIFLDQQDKDHDVRRRLGEIAGDLPHRCALLPDPTPGPAVTLLQGIEQAGVSGGIIVCDCDHDLDVDPIFAALAADDSIDCILPTWSLDGEPLTSWSVAGIVADGLVTDIAEKALPSSGERFRGVIGCYYFRDSAEVLDVIRAAGDSIYISDIVRALIGRGRKVVAVDVETARFFGDPQRLEAATR